jgi:predicted nucleic acid-binding protein
VIVADASAMLEVLLNTPAASVIAAHMFASSESIYVPHLIDVEVAQVLRRYARTNTISPTRARQALDDYSNMPLNRYPHDVLLPRIWGLRHNLTAYDAAYIALAEALSATLLTCDQALASSPGHRAKVLVF